MTAEEIIKSCGGPGSILVHFSAHPKLSFGSTQTVYNWRANGIPEPYWVEMVELSAADIDLKTLSDMNEAIRAAK